MALSPEKREEVKAALKEAQAKFPTVLGPEDHKPLGVGVRKELAKEMGWSNRLAGMVLGRFCNRDSYQAMLTKHDAKRYGLNGEVVGEVTEDERQHAQDHLKLSKQIRKRKKREQKRREQEAATS